MSWSSDSDRDVLTAEAAADLAAVALGHVRREYPNKLDHVLDGAADARTPSSLHPIFYGSFDWHSCVHSYWLLASLRRLCPTLPQSKAIEALFDDALTDVKVAAECAYLARPSARGFERPYGWAWLLMLQAELLRHVDPLGRHWAIALGPLAQAFVERFLSYLPKAGYPVRAGVHTNTAFALRLAAEYCATAGDEDLRKLLEDRARHWYGTDVDCQAWEPCGDDFLSSALMEAECMRSLLPAQDFDTWFAGFLPRLREGEPVTLFRPATVSDRSDGKIAHLDGFNLSRAWCWRELTTALADADPLRQLVDATAKRHLQASLPHLTGDYMGEHWLASFALLALGAPRRRTGSEGADNAGATAMFPSSP